MKEFEDKLAELKSQLEKETDQKIKAGLEKEIKALEAKMPDVKSITDGIEEIKKWQVKKDEADKKNQEALDNLIIEGQKKTPEKKIFSDVFAEAVEKNFDDIARVRKGQSFKMELKAVGNMTLSSNLLSGTSQVHYGTNAFLPNQKINFRDLIPTSMSDTLVHSYYRESAGEGAVASQTEGSAKGQLDFDFSEVQKVNAYIAGYARFSKQMAKALPWMQTTLPRLLLRQFYSVENSSFFSTVSAAATGDTTTAETDDVKQIMDYISNQRTAKYAASFGLVSHIQLARLNKLTYTTGNYIGSGGVLTRVDGSMEISGMPIIPADWVTDDKILIFDRDYLERVEAESLTVEFFEQDSDNVQKNLITARVECLEVVNPMVPASMIYADLGNVV